MHALHVEQQPGWPAAANVLHMYIRLFFKDRHYDAIALAAKRDHPVVCKHQVRIKTHD
jgi:hypothetical protein